MQYPNISQRELSKRVYPNKQSKRNIQNKNRIMKDRHEYIWTQDYVQCPIFN